MDIKLYTVAAAICLSIGFTNCEHKSDEIREDNTRLTNDTIEKVESVDVVNVGVELMYRFKNDSFASKLQSRFSDYFTRITGSEEVRSFYDEKSQAFYSRPEFPQSINLFYDGRFFSKHKPMIIAIYRQDRDTIAKLNFTRVDTAGVATLMGIIDFGIKVKNNDVYFSSMALINSENWVEKKVNSITYYYPSSHDFSEKEAFKMEEFNKELATLFDVEPREIKYYVCDTYSEIKKLQGVNYEYDMFNMDAFGGSSDIANKIIYSGNGSEYYPHELVHQYVPYWVGTGHINMWFEEGVCTFLGGSRGEDLEWHIGVLKKYIADHNPDLSDVNKLPIMLGHSTGIEYVIGGLMCKLAYEKGGIDAVKDLLLSGNHHESFYDGINFVLGVEKKDFPAYLINELEKY